MAALVYPEIDPRNEAELVEQAIAAVYSYSNGSLNDFSSASPLRVLVEGLCFAGAEILYYANNVIEALVVSYLSNYGISRSLGTASQTLLNFTLTSAFGTAIQLPAGTQVQTQNGMIFSTDADLVFPAGAIVGTVAATAGTVGKATNVAANSINQMLQPLSYIQTVNNPTAATGGSDEETQQQAIDRGLAAVRRRNLVSAADYEDYAKEILGVGSVAYAIGNRSGDGISYLPGSVCLYCLDAAGEAPNTADLTALVQQMSPRTMIGTALFTRPIELVETRIKVVAKITPGEAPDTVGDALWEAVKEYLDPNQRSMGGSLIRNELMVALGQTGAIEYVQSLLINNVGADMVLPNDHSMPKAFTLEVTLIDALDNEYYVARATDARNFVYEGDII